MAQRIRSSAKWKHTFNALSLAQQAIGGKPAKQFLIPDSSSFDAERWFAPRATAEEKAEGRDLLDYCFVGEGFDLTIDRGDAYWEGPREVLSDEEKARRRAVLADLHETLGL